MMPLHYMRFWRRQTLEQMQLFKISWAARGTRRRCVLPLGLRAWMPGGGNPVLRLWGFLLRPLRRADLGKQVRIEKIARAAVDFFVRKLL